MEELLWSLCEYSSAALLCCVSVCIGYIPPQSVHIIFPNCEWSVCRCDHASCAHAQVRGGGLWGHLGHQGQSHWEYLLRCWCRAVPHPLLGGGQGRTGWPLQEDPLHHRGRLTHVQPCRYRRKCMCHTVHTQTCGKWVFTCVESRRVSDWSFTLRCPRRAIHSKHGQCSRARLACRYDAPGSPGGENFQFPFSVFGYLWQHILTQPTIKRIPMKWEFWKWNLAVGLMTIKLWGKSRVFLKWQPMKWCIYM